MFDITNLFNYNVFVRFCFLYDGGFMKKALNIITIIVSFCLIAAFTVGLIIFYPQYDKYRSDDFQRLNICYENVNITAMGNGTNALSVVFFNLTKKEQTLKVVFYINETDVFYSEIQLGSKEVKTFYEYYSSLNTEDRKNPDIQIYLANDDITAVNVLDGKTVVKRPTNGDTLEEHLKKNAESLEDGIFLARVLSNNWKESFDFNMLICWIMLGVSSLLLIINSISLVLNCKKNR